MFTKKVMTIIGAILAVLSLVGGIWAIEEHYATNKTLDHKIEGVEFQVAGAIQNIQIKTDYKFYQFMYDKLTNDMFLLRKQMRDNPNDAMLKQDYKDVCDQRKEMKIKLEQLMRKID